MSSRIRLSVKTAACVTLLGATVASMAEQPLPATKHQANVIEDVKRKQMTKPEAEMKMPVSKHQEQVLREFEEADTNRDGNLTKEEYSAYMVHNTAARYNADLMKPEKQGVEAAGPRDRHAAENTHHPIATGDPTVSD